MSDEVKVEVAVATEVVEKTRKNHAWDDESKEFVRKHANTLTDVQGAKLLSEKLNKPVSVSSYRKVRQDLGVKKSPGRGVSKVVVDGPTCGTVLAPDVKEVVEEAKPEAVSPF